MCYRQNRELSPLDVEAIYHQEDQYGDDLLASIESAPYHVVGLSDCTRCLEADIRGRALRTVEDDELLTKTSSSRGH